MSQPICHFFRLPRELRDIVCDNYVFYPTAYSHDASRNKLVLGCGGNIDLSLMRTCRQTLEEMKDLPLRKNTITFRPFCNPDSSERAGILHAVVHRVEKSVNLKLNLYAGAHLTDEVITEIFSDFPQLRHLVDAIKTMKTTKQGSFIGDSTFSETWGEAPSVYRNFMRCAFVLLSEVPRFAREHSNCSDIYGDFVSSTPNPWDILTAQDVEHIYAEAYTNFDRHHMAFVTPSDNYAVSAAATAISFLKSLPASTRRNVRNIQLIEDRESIAYRACHLRGMIPFCQENTKLRICHVANLWNCIIEPGQSPRGDRVGVNGRCASRYITEWIAEAAALPSLGMPKDSFTLILDGEPLPDKSTDIFNVVRQDAAVQSALDACIARGLPHMIPHALQRWVPDLGLWHIRRMQQCYRFEGLPAVLEDIAANRGNIRCNFPFGPKVDVKELVQRNGKFTLGEWVDYEHESRCIHFETESPLPSWKELCLFATLDADDARRDRCVMCVAAKVRLSPSNLLDVVAAASVQH